MKHTVSRIAVACAMLFVAMASHAANTDPFDFDYEIAGGIAERPALIFNDGSKTYIQPRAGQVITAAGGHQEGPYVVVDGTPETITYMVAGRSASARAGRGPMPSSEPVRADRSRYCATTSPLHSTASRIDWC
jgi:hypothetical protein